MTRRRGPKTGFVPADLVAFLDCCSAYATDGIPKRRRLTIGGVPVTQTDARMIRRWRAGKIQGVTKKSAISLLGRYGYGIGDFNTWCIETNTAACIQFNDKEIS